MEKKERNKEARIRRLAEKEQKQQEKTAEKERKEQEKKQKKNTGDRQSKENKSPNVEKNVSLEEVVANSSFEDTDVDKFNVNDFVIVNYNEQLFPGKIIGSRYNDDEELEFEVSHMDKKGLNWVWPDKIDILWYTENEIVKKINEPELKNKRGLYVVQEISEFL